MTRSQMQSAVIQSTILVTLNMIISHEIGRNAYDNVWEDPVLKNLTTAFKNIPSNATASSNATALTNSTSSATGSASPLTFLEEPEAFYLSFLPRNVFVYALLCPLSYYWQIYLERFFPTRPRGVEIDYKKKEKVEVDMNEGREEEVVKRWIAQGKVRRSSVSWWNTFVKWVLHVTVGELWISSLGRFVVEFVRWRSLAKVLKNFKSVCDIIPLLCTLKSSFAGIPFIFDSYLASGANLELLGNTVEPVHLIPEHWPLGLAHRLRCHTRDKTRRVRGRHRHGRGRLFQRFLPSGYPMGRAYEDSAGIHGQFY